MKLTNKGKEFLQIRNIIKNTKGIVIFGAGEYGSRIYDQIKNIITVIGFADNDVMKQRDGRRGLKVYSYDELIKLEEEHIIVIAISNEEHKRDIISNLILEGYEVDKNVFLFNKFLMLCYAFLENKVYIEGCAMSITQKCTLNCEKCSILTPYVECPTHYDLDKLKNNIDLFFCAVDVLGGLTLIGGEAFLYPYLNELVYYIGDKYRDRMNSFSIITNGMILPSQKLINSFQKYNIRITISDYTKSLPQITKSVQNFIKLLKKNNVLHSVYETNYWIDFGYEKTQLKQYSEEQLANFFESCNMPCRLIEDEKLYYCANSKYAINAGLLERDYHNEFDLRSFKKNDMFYLLEFDNGFNECGYIEMCKRCDGYLSINKNYIEVAKQVPK